MGIDWFRMRPKQNAPESELHRLIDMQAEAFQGLPSMWSTEQIEPLEIYDEEEARRLGQQYGESSRTLRELLDFPAWDESTHTPHDYPELLVCWRVYPITHYSIFPIRWRVQAHCTYLPEPLREQLRIWKDWVSAVSEGHFRQYLLDLYLYDITIRINYLYRDIRSVAEESLTRTGRWATKPDLVSVRERILSFQVPALYPAPIHSSAQADISVNLAEHEAYQSINQQVHELIALTRSWDANVRENKKIRYYENYYMTFDQFLAQANDKWLHDFMAWAEACCSKEMGLFLDY
jgi:hypothetical protein